MAKKRMLYITQEVAPYLPADDFSTYGRELAKGLHENGYEVRIFTPNYGLVNERRNQLHEVIRLSGLNIVINDQDHPLIIKVASLQPWRIQAYFTDNDDYFQKDANDVDAVGSNRKDNDERSIFFARGASETVKKLRWEPEVIHCAGWITALTPVYLRKMMRTEALYENSKIVYEVMPGEVSGGIDPRIFDKLADDDIENIEQLRTENTNTNTLHLLAINNSDAVIFNMENPSEELLNAAKEKGIPFITRAELGENVDAEKYSDFYESLKK